MPEPEMTDAEDVRRTLTGDREAFGRLFDRHARSVRAVVAAVSCDFQAVEDMTQETFLRAHERLRTLKDPTAFRAWVHGIARLVAKESRGESRFQHGAEVIGELVSGEPTAIDVVQQREEQQMMLKLLLDVPERERLAVHAYFFHDQNGDDASAALGLSRSGFYAALDRGLQRIRQRLRAIEGRSADARSTK